MFEEAAKLIRTSRRTIAFTGAGISVESGIPPFRGENGLWNRYDPATFDINYFMSNPQQSWTVMRDIFYDLFGNVKPNAAHYALAELEARGMLQGIITQNVDNLHTDAGSAVVHEFHGSLKKLVCIKCNKKIPVEKVSLDILPPRCTKCQGILKPDAVFFGEGIPENPYTSAFREAERSNLFILIGSTGEVAPANMIPRMAKGNGAKIIEINIAESSYTGSVTDIFLQGKATEMMELLVEAIDSE
ncbi:NAD-dependent deacetylase 1 [Desulfamplus magnetovallimortis]|uniref:protein acetyllysine N-acetyltransferase n=1 Tax=Desulfamplus magnetovallimortis TaxID=1246637 RepID=A0A1W1HBE1_9BACT|nr:NAD-dependent deacylase [Desulfamplus magnetovallimortis]SLM29807.1 NAD-dependent deacetylase 1 [Desulfamplus magnetovallimortis]